MKQIFASLSTVFLGLAPPVMAESLDWTAGPFDMPESAIFDPAQDRIIVSVIVGHPGAADGDGYLALVSPEGEVLQQNWITGLSAPKGMGILGDVLLVADLTQLHEIDIPSGTLIRSMDVPGAVFLNDITTDGEQAYVSDFMGNRIWRYHDGDMTVWLDDDALAHPNGLLLDGSRLLVASWGQGMRDDFTTEAPGALLAVDLQTQAVRAIAPELGNLDGIARIGDRLLVNDWITGQVFEIDPDGSYSVTAQYPAGLADIAAYGDMLLLPSMLEGHVSAQTYP